MERYFLPTNKLESKFRDIGISRKLFVQLTTFCLALVLTACGDNKKVGLGNFKDDCAAKVDSIAKAEAVAVAIQVKVDSVTQSTAKLDSNLYELRQELM